MKALLSTMENDWGWRKPCRRQRASLCYLTWSVVIWQDSGLWKHLPGGSWEISYTSLDMSLSTCIKNILWRQMAKHLHKGICFDLHSRVWTSWELIFPFFVKLIQSKTTWFTTYWQMVNKKRNSNRKVHSHSKVTELSPTPATATKWVEPGALTVCQLYEISLMAVENVDENNYTISFR